MEPPDPPGATPSADSFVASWATALAWITYMS